MKLKHIHLLAKSSNYDTDAKEKYRKAAMKYLRALAKTLGLDKGTYNVRFNAGGIAVSGDAILHHEKFYFTIGESGVMWRTCKGRQDYTGGANNWVIGFGSSVEDEVLVGQILKAIE